MRSTLTLEKLQLTDAILCSPNPIILGNASIDVSNWLLCESSPKQNITDIARCNYIERDNDAF